MASHQSLAVPPVGIWRADAGCALALRSPTAGVLRAVQGRLWLTFDGPHTGGPRGLGDWVLLPGDELPLPAGCRLVLECLTREGATFCWQPAAAAQGASRGAPGRWLRTSPCALAWLALGAPGLLKKERATS